MMWSVAMVWTVNDYRKGGMNIVAHVENVGIDWHVSKSAAQLLMVEVDIPVWVIHIHAGFQYRLFSGIPLWRDNWHI